MFALPSTTLLGWVLLAVPTDTAARSPLPVCEMGTRHLELTADAPIKEVCIHPGESTTFVFNSRLARVELTGPERFRVVDEGTVSLTLIPSEALTTGERVPMTLHFQDGAAPASATFELVVHPSQAERLVEVTARQCQEEKSRVQAECSGKMGLTGLVAQRLIGERGVASKNLKDDITARPGNTLASLNARSYRSDTERTEGKQKVVRLAVELTLRNNGETPWTPAGAVLVGPRHAELKVLGMWPREPIPPKAKQRVVVEVEATEDEARGTFTLKLWSQEGSARDELLDGVTFP